MLDEQFAEASRRAQRPVAYHILLCPHSPASGALLSPKGEPVLTDYSKVDWKSLAAAARAVIDEYVPKKVGVFVADDAVDVMDVLHVSTDTGLAFENQKTFEHRIHQTIAQVSMADMRAGVTRISRHAPGLHINTPVLGKRPPVGALILSIKFADTLQMFDYFYGAAHALFEAPVMAMGIHGIEPLPANCPMPDFLREWLHAQFGVVYGEGCFVVGLSPTFSD